MHPACAEEAENARPHKHLMLRMTSKLHGSPPQDRPACLSRPGAGRIAPAGGDSHWLRCRLGVERKRRSLRDQPWPLRHPAALPSAPRRRSGESDQLLPRQMSRSLYCCGCGSRSRTPPARRACARRVFGRPRRTGRGVKAASGGLGLLNPRPEQNAS